jgi:hypothetical protein
VLIILGERNILLVVAKPIADSQLGLMHWRKAIGVGLLSPLADILVLTALAFTPISDVAPLREISVCRDSGDTAG